MERKEIEAYLNRLSDLLGHRNTVGEILMRQLGLRRAGAVLEIVEKYYPRNRIQPKTRFAIEELCQEHESS